MNQADQHTREQRRARRKPVNFAAAVTDTITEQPFGQLGNLSATGLLLISPTAPNDEAIYQLRLPLPGNDNTLLQYIEVGVQEQWHENAPSAGRVWTGYRIIAIGEDDAARLETWLETSV